MVRKTKEETEKTRLSLLDAALNVFSTKGFVRSTLNDIAREAGVSRGAIYWHFKDKVDLFEALSEHIDDCTGAHRDDLLEKPITSLEEFRRMVLEWLTNLDTDEKFRTFYEFINFKIEYHEELAPVLAKEREMKRRVLNRFVTDFTNMQLEGKMRPDIEPRQAALMAVFFVQGLVEVWLFDHDLFSITEDAPGMIDQFLKSFAPEPGRVQAGSFSPVAEEPGRV
ncbi:MAG: TetR family transcriptional regulator [Acidobacteriota bacterium]|nr:TetR family transcriptional regulator [Acidobacteriota bacterium]